MSETNTEATGNTTNNDMAEKLANAEAKLTAQKAQRTVKVVKGAGLNADFLAAAEARGLVREEKSGFYKLTSPASKGKVVYLATKGGRVDLSGFTVQNPAVTQLTPEQAREKHLGKVRGQLNFDLFDQEGGADQLKAAFVAALDDLAIPLPTPEKPVKAPRVKKEKPAEKSEAAPTEPASTEAAPAEPAAS